MLGPVDHAHAAAADPLLDPVARDDLADPRVVGRVRHDPIMDTLSGLRVLVAGDDPKTVEVARSGLAAQGAVAEVCAADPAAVATLAASGAPPSAIVALEGSEEALRAGLDPLGLEAGPPVVPIADLSGTKS